MVTNPVTHSSPKILFMLIGTGVLKWVIIIKITSLSKCNVLFIAITTISNSEASTKKNVRND